MKIAIIAAIGRNGELGYNGKLPWRISEDLKRFKDITDGNVVVMGRKTFESLPKKLDNRTIIILTTKDYAVSKEHCNDVIVMHTLAEAIEYAYRNDLETLYVAGGGEMYKHFLPLANQLYLTVVEGEFIADTFFPRLNLSEWQLKSSRDSHNEDYIYQFLYYERIR